MNESTNNSKTPMTDEQKVKLAEGKRQAEVRLIELAMALVANGMTVDEAQAEARAQLKVESEPQTIKVGNRKSGGKIVAKTLAIGGKTVELTLAGKVSINGKAVA